MKSAGLITHTLIATLLLSAGIARGQELKPTNHPRLPAKTSDYWLAPSAAELRGARSAALTQLQEAVRLEVESNYARALPILAQASLHQGPLGDYAEYYEGLAELRLGRHADAKKTFEGLAAKPIVGFLLEGSSLRLGETHEALGDQRAALGVYERLSKMPTTAPDDVWMRVGRMARAIGETDRAIDAFSHVLYEFPFSDRAAEASTELESLPAPPVIAGSTRYKLELGRAERLFGAKRYTAARPIFEAVRRVASGDDHELVDLRIAECDYFLKRTRAAQDALKPYTEKASRQGEALYFYAIATRELGDRAEYLRLVQRIVDEFPNQSWAEEALNNVATQHILQDDDEEAVETFRTMVDRYPNGHYSDRAAWKFGWWAYKNGRYADAIRAFEVAAAFYARSDYRPMWLYWAARAHEALKNQTVADQRYVLVATDYLNSYYGRLAVARLASRGVAAPQRRLIADVSQSPEDDGATAPARLPDNQRTIRALLSLGLYDQALDELRYAQRAWGDSSAIQATLGWIYNKQGDLRAGINAMKRAYPQYLAAGGEQMPLALQKIRFPVDYWPQIQRYAAEHELDPYMIAALINQESNFDAGIRSAANAYGLMQLVPATGRQYARSLQPARRFSLSLLTTADTNLRMGTAYFSDLVKRFGGAHYALATYNAGPGRVARWMAERPGIDRDEFIDDIPYPETQDYVKKIIGQAEDYRRLYGPDAPSGAEDDDVVPAARKTSKAKPPAASSSKKKPAAKPKTPAKKPTTRKRG
jgi:soluble lytic murein transglycosylase